MPLRASGLRLLILPLAVMAATLRAGRQAITGGIQSAIPPSGHLGGCAGPKYHYGCEITLDREGPATYIFPL